ncbi:MAG: AroM protein [Rhodobacteraceae bacterium]|nr:AroM protein [Paracoccaceae bacterium]
MQEAAIGFIVISQTPRPKLTNELMQVCAPVRQIVQIGTLDGLSPAEIAALSPKDDKDTLFTTLPDGSDIKVSKQETYRLVHRCLDKLHERSVSAALLCCSSRFPDFESKVRLLQPSRVLSGLVQAVLPKGRLGLLLPLPEQIESITGKWRRDDIEVVGEAVAPGSSPENITAAASALAQRMPDLILMDCMAYTAAERTLVRSVYSGPILTAMSASGRVLDELAS